ncbi:hypothetical protein P5673_017332 [Acropora cervicornis]|uniref:Uncharacterized protein n=1 Tax=Acropora cervicornis TaxID=6130 RepID=A0AAD9V4E6_ACRCE|nr:hypothetical protein P5673_017332 [Acropora cervicornis]
MILGQIFLLLSSSDTSCHNKPTVSFSAIIGVDDSRRIHKMKYQFFEENTMSYRKKFSSAVRANPDVLSTNKGRMPSIYHEHCGKPGPKSNDYLPPPGTRFFKSRSAPNSPLLGPRKPLIPSRASPRPTRGLNQGPDGQTIAKSLKTSRVGRSRSFNNKGMCFPMALAILQYRTQRSPH